MNIGIVVLSNTGHTLSVAEGIGKALEDIGHKVTVERVTALNSNPNTKSGQILKNAPDINPYDAVIFGSPVWAFHLAAVMSQYMSGLPKMKGKIICCFVTQQLRYAWLGGNRAIRKMSSICKDREAETAALGIINWSSPKRSQQVSDLTDRIVRKIGSASPAKARGSSKKE